MALTTQCPHCHTTFRVAADQLKLRGGIVRCGACQQVFDGAAALVDLNTSGRALAGTNDAPALVEPALQQEGEAPGEAADHQETTGAESTPATPPVAAVADAESAPLPPTQAPTGPPPASREPVYTLDLDRTFDHFGILPDVDAPATIIDVEAETLPSPAASEAEPSADDTIVAAPTPGHAQPDAVPDVPADVPDGAHAASPPLRKSAGIEYSPDAAVQARNRNKKGGRRAKPTTMPRPKLRAHDADEPEFVKRARSKEEGSRARRLALVAGCVLLLAALSAQLFASTHNVLAARYPGARSLLASVCAAFGCKLALPAQIETLNVETGELQTLGNGAFTFSTLLRNQGSMTQAWPSLELTLNDANDKPLVRRVFAPRDYLGAGAPAGFAARSEQPVRLSFQLRQLTPSGYHIAIFYP